MESTGATRRGSRRTTKAPREAATETTEAASHAAPTNAVENTLDHEAERPVEVDTTMAEQEVKAPAAPAPEANKEVTALSVQSDAEKSGNGKMQISGSIWDRPVMPDSMEIADTYSVAGDRPIAASHMHVFGTILNNRPIMASDIRVLDVTAVGGRPVFASDIVVRDDLTLPGGRPIVASDPRLLDATLLPGGRPIASNEIDDPEVLMGYLD